MAGIPPDCTIAAGEGLFLTAIVCAPGAKVQVGMGERLRAFSFGTPVRQRHNKMANFRSFVRVDAPTSPIARQKKGCARPDLSRPHHTRLCARTSGKTLKFSEAQRISLHAVVKHFFFPVFILRPTSLTVSNGAGARHGAIGKTPLITGTLLFFAVQGLLPTKALWYILLRACPYGRFGADLSSSFWSTRRTS